MAQFELTFLTDNETASKKAEELLQSFDGKKTAVNDWGSRELAYPIDKKEKCNYVTWTIEIGSDKIAPFRQKLNFEKTFLRYLILSAPEQAKKSKPRKVETTQ